LALHGSAAGFDSSTVHYSPELWRAYIEAEFPGEVEYVEAVMDCESGGNPDALGWAANEIGLMQINPGPWSYLWTEPGQPFYGLDPWEPAVNVEIAKTIRDTRRGWAHWTCARIIGLP
jgi:soluble lytic murein transglycosylase-like protein